MPTESKRTSIIPFTYMNEHQSSVKVDVIVTRTTSQSIFEGGKLMCK